MHRKQSRFPWSPGGAARRDRLHTAAKARENQGRRTDLNLLENSPKSKPIDTRAELAKIAGVSHDTIARGELALKRKHIIAAKAKENQIRKPKSVPQISVEQKIDTQKELAKIAGVSHDTITRLRRSCRRHRRR